MSRRSYSSCSTPLTTAYSVRIVIIFPTGTRQVQLLCPEIQLLSSPAADCSTEMHNAMTFRTKRNQVLL